VIHEDELLGFRERVEVSPYGAEPVEDQSVVNLFTIAEAVDLVTLDLGPDPPIGAPIHLIFIPGDEPALPRCSLPISSRMNGNFCTVEMMIFLPRPPGIRLGV
jgi:hypothetical protein